MKVFALSETRGLSCAWIVKRSAQLPIHGEIRVALKLTVLNHREIWISHGQYPDVKLPSSLGAYAAGTIDSAGPGIDQALSGSTWFSIPLSTGGGDDGHAWFRSSYPPLSTPRVDARHIHGGRLNVFMSMREHTETHARDRGDAPICAICARDGATSAESLR